MIILKEERKKRRKEKFIKINKYIDHWWVNVVWRNYYVTSCGMQCFLDSFENFAYRCALKKIKYFLSEDGWLCCTVNLFPTFYFCIQPTIWKQFTRLILEKSFATIHTPYLHNFPQRCSFFFFSTSIFHSEFTTENWNSIFHFDLTRDKSW